LFSGWAVRCRLLPGGQRHVVGILLPGDMIGLQSALCGASDEVVEAVTDVTFCILDDRRLRELFRTNGLGNRLARMLAWENLQLANRLAVAGACSARASLAHLICDLHGRLAQRRMTQGYSFKLPLSLKQVAEVLGLTPVHLHRVLRGLRKDELLALENKIVTILDYDRLAACGASFAPSTAKAPFL
jgi:CRP-like cAMP-binding protein